LCGCSVRVLGTKYCLWKILRWSRDDCQRAAMGADDDAGEHLENPSAKARQCPGRSCQSIRHSDGGALATVRLTRRLRRLMCAGGGGNWGICGESVPRGRRKRVGALRRLLMPLSCQRLRRRLCFGWLTLRCPRHIGLCCCTSIAFIVMLFIAIGQLMKHGAIRIDARHAR
jgi:hypothetical protein